MDLESQQDDDPVIGQTVPHCRIPEKLGGSWKGSATGAVTMRTFFAPLLV